MINQNPSRRKAARQGNFRQYTKRQFLTGTLFATVCAGLAPLPVAGAPVNFFVNPLPNAVSQGNAELCWLAASAVMFSYRDNAAVSMADAAARLGGVYVIKDAQGAALDYSEIPAWKLAGGFRSQAQQSLDASGWEQLLKSHGPLITLVDGSGTGTLNHAVVVVGIAGDGTQGRTVISFANGQSGTVETLTLSDFSTVFELPSNSDVVFSVAYFA